jgi:hypothetical protein
VTDALNAEDQHGTALVTSPSFAAQDGAGSGNGLDGGLPDSNPTGTDSGQGVARVLVGSASVGSRARDVRLLVGRFQNTSQRIANLLSQLRRRSVFQDISHSVDREVRADIAQRFVLA